MVRALALLALTALLGRVVAEEACDTPNVEEASLLQQSKLQNVEVKSHSSTTCAHLQEAEKRMTERTKNAAKCLSGLAKGEEYCQPGDEVDCPGSPGVTCGISINKPCCPNPCVGVPPYGTAKTFPCPSNPDTIVDDEQDGCASDKKVDNCLDPCAPTPTPTPPPTPPPLWTCKESDIDFPGFKATAPEPNMACKTGATCYGDDISTCASGATCYATGTIQNCKTGARCCAKQEIGVCSREATCFAKDIGLCKKGATCVERPKWGDDDDAK